jgi:hypothetical protein
MKRACVLVAELRADALAGGACGLTLPAGSGARHGRQGGRPAPCGVGKLAVRKDKRVVWQGAFSRGAGGEGMTDTPERGGGDAVPTGAGSRSSPTALRQATYGPRLPASGLAELSRVRFAAQKAKRAPLTAPPLRLGMGDCVLVKVTDLQGDGLLRAKPERQMQGNGSTGGRAQNKGLVSWGSQA